MSRDTRVVLEFLKKHGVGKKLRRLAGVIWTVARNITGWLFDLLRRRASFVSAMLMAIIAAIVVVDTPLVGSFLAAVFIILGTLTGLIQEFTESLKGKQVTQ